jgi:hypothetical protein
MKTAELKADLYKLIDQTDDIAILKAVKTLLGKRVYKRNIKDFWDDLPDDIKTKLEESLVQSDKDEVYTHEEVVMEMKAIYNLGL